MAKQYAIEHHYEFIEFPADWDKYGKSAGYRRNKEMVDIASAAICFWDGKSKGTLDAITYAKQIDVPTIVHLFIDLD